MLILFFLLSYTVSEPVSATDSSFFLVSPIITTHDRDFPSQLNKLRIISSVSNYGDIEGEVEKINQLYYNNLNRILLPTDSQKDKIVAFLGLAPSRKEEWFLSWNDSMDIDEAKRARSAIGINFCKFKELELPQGYIPILNLHFLENLGNYHYVSDVLEAYELARLFSIRTFATEKEALAWGLFQLQGIRMQYAYFEYHFKEDFHQPLPPLTTDYIGGMNEAQLLSHFEQFTTNNQELIDSAYYSELISVLEN